MKTILAYLGILLCFVLLPTAAHAQEQSYNVDYDFNFYIDKQSTDLDVELDVTITNLRSDVYVTEFTLRFPKNFLFSNLDVSSSFGEVPYVVSEKEFTKNIIFKFDEPNSGSQTQNKLKLKYTLKDMHTPRGRINEVILPLLVNTNPENISATLHLPENFDKKISISKPVPTNIEFNKITWDKVDARTIFTLFGNSQLYDVQLSYSLVNPNITSSVQTIALPPETLYQKVFVDNIQPKPLKTYTDRDGNFLADYRVGPRSHVDVKFSGAVEVFVRPQSSLRNYMRSRFNKQENYLLTEEDQWSLGDVLNDIPLNQLQTPENIYDFTTSNLSYAQNRVSADQQRFGAEKALLNPDRAVCMEYTDVFIALAREKGIPAREIQGYGYSESSRIRPQSLILDLLHAWPEYYDRQDELWIQVDPTWEDTSGIDYFSGFDVNHIALAIHGEDPVEPYPAGFYKTEARKDVNVTISDRDLISETPTKITYDLNDELIAGKQYKGTVTITNIGNTFAHNLHILPEASNVVFDPPSVQVEYLAPLESRDVSVTYTPTENVSSQETITFRQDGDVLGAHDVRILSSLRADLRTALIAFLGILLLAGLYIGLQKYKNST